RYVFLHIFLHTIQVERWQKFPVRHGLYSILVPAYPNKFFNVGVPRGHIVITNGPLQAIPVFVGSLKFVIAPPLASSAPSEGLAPHLVSPDPIKRFFLNIGVIGILNKKLGSTFIDSIAFGNQRILIDVFLG